MRYGRIGTEGQTQVKAHAAPAEAKVAAEKQIAEKVQKGYREVSGEAAGTAPKAPAKKAVAKKAAPSAPPSAQDVAAEEAIEDRERMQTICLTGPFHATIPPKLRKMMEQEIEFVFLRGHALYVGYDLDVSSMYGSPFGKSEADFSAFVNEFEALLPKLALFTAWLELWGASKFCA